MTNTALLAELNAFRAAEGKAAFADWRPARHLPMLNAYRETAPAAGPAAHQANAVDSFEATTEELAAQQVRPVDEVVVETEVKPQVDILAKLQAENEKANEKIVARKADKPAKVAKEKAPKGKSYKEAARYDKSAIESPVKFVHSFLDANPGLSRKDAVITLTEQHGVNYSTARTQYQKWFSARKAAKSDG